MRLITPPFPAASRPSKITTTLSPVARTYSCMITSSRWSFRSSSSKRLRLSFAGFGSASSPEGSAAMSGGDVDVPELAPLHGSAGRLGGAHAPEVHAGLHGLAGVRLAAPAERVAAGLHVAQARVL